MAIDLLVEGTPLAGLGAIYGRVVPIEQFF
jgi:hypothetical protein